MKLKRTRPSKKRKTGAEQLPLLRDLSALTQCATFQQQLEGVSDFDARVNVAATCLVQLVVGKVYPIKSLIQQIHDCAGVRVHGNNQTTWIPPRSAAVKTDCDVVAAAAGAALRLQKPKNIIKMEKCIDTWARQTKLSSLFKVYINFLMTLYPDITLTSIVQVDAAGVLAEVEQQAGEAEVVKLRKPTAEEVQSVRNQFEGQWTHPDKMQPTVHDVYGMLYTCICCLRNVYA